MENEDHGGIMQELSSVLEDERNFICNGCPRRPLLLSQPGSAVIDIRRLRDELSSEHRPCADSLHKCLFSRCLQRLREHTRRFRCSQNCREQIL